MMRCPRLLVILPKLFMVSVVNLNGFVGSQKVGLAPVPSGLVTIFAASQVVSNVRLISLLRGLVISNLDGYAWLKMLKNPLRNCSDLLSLILKFLKKDTSKLLRFGVRI